MLLCFMICFPPLQILRRGEVASGRNNQSRRIYKSLRITVYIFENHPRKSHFTLFASEAKNETFCCRISNSIKYCLLHLLKGQNSTCKDSAHWCKHRRTSVCSTASAKYERPAKYPLNWCRYRFSEPVTKIKVETFFWPSSASSSVVVA